MIGNIISIKKLFGHIGDQFKIEWDCYTFFIKFKIANFNSNKVRKNFSNEKLVKTTITTGGKNQKLVISDKNSRNKNQASTRNSAYDSCLDVMKSDNFKMKNKLFSSCSNIRPRNNGKIVYKS